MPMPLNVELLDAVVLGCKEPVGDLALEPHHLLTDLSHVGNLRGQLQTEADVGTEAWKCRSLAHLPLVEVHGAIQVGQLLPESESLCLSSLLVGRGSETVSMAHYPSYNHFSI